MGFPETAVATDGWTGRARVRSGEGPRRACGQVGPWVPRECRGAELRAFQEAWI